MFFLSDKVVVSIQSLESLTNQILKVDQSLMAIAAMNRKYLDNTTTPTNITIKDYILILSVTY